MFDQHSFDWIERGRVGYAIVNWLSRGCANTIEVFLHRRFGHRYFGLHSFVVIFVMILFAAYWENQGSDAHPILHYACFYAVVLVFTISACLVRHSCGYIEHSRYSGQPMFFRPTSVEKEHRVKDIYEPILTILLGFWLIDAYSLPLGLWLIIAGSCMFRINGEQRQFQKQQDADLQDAIIEQRARMEQARELQRRLGI